LLEKGGADDPFLKGKGKKTWLRYWKTNRYKTSQNRIPGGRPSASPVGMMEKKVEKPKDASRKKRGDM